MFKAVFNLFLVFIISISASGIPVDRNALDFSIYLPAPSQNAQKLYTTELPNSTITNPTTIKFIIESPTPMEELTSEEKDSFVLDIFKNDEKVGNFKASDFIISQENKNDTEIVLNLNLSQSHLGLQSGEYIFKIYSEYKSFTNVDAIDLEVTYKPIAPYIQASNVMNSGMMNLTLYFPYTGNEKYLVPVTRFVPYDRAVLRTTINNLHEGSSILGFENPIPNIPRLQVSNETLTIHLPADLGMYDESEEMGYFAYRSLVNSLSPTPGVSRIKFLVNGRESDNFFHGYNTSSIYEPDLKIPKVYLAMDINELRTVLVPIDLNTFDVDKISSEIFNILQTGIYEGTILIDLFPPVPNDIRLISTGQDDNITTLNFSKEFLYAYPEREDLQKLMIDSLIFSYTSLEFTDRVQFLVENQIIDSFAGLSLAEPLKRSKYINPEKE